MIGRFFKFQVAYYFNKFFRNVTLRRDRMGPKSAVEDLCPVRLVLTFRFFSLPELFIRGLE